MRAAPIDLTEAVADDPAVEWRRLKESLATVRRHVQRVRARAAREVGEAEAAIFDAHLLLLDDADLLDQVHTRVDEGQAAAPAWADAVGHIGAERGLVALRPGPRPARHPALTLLAAGPG
jgi:phosphocarrier protein FPr